MGSYILHSLIINQINLVIDPHKGEPVWRGDGCGGGAARCARPPVAAAPGFGPAGGAPPPGGATERPKFAATGSGTDSAAPPTRIRTEFPETWLWSDHVTE